MSPSDRDHLDDAGPIGQRRLDLRLVPAAATVWAGAAWALTASGTLVIVAAAVAVVVGVVAVSWRRLPRRLVMGSVAVALVAALAATGMRMSTLERSVVAELGRDRAIGVVTVRLTGDVVLLPRKGVRPELARAKAVVVTLEARGRQITGRVPVEVTATGEVARGLARVRAGTTMVVTGRLSAPDPGQAIAASVRVTDLGAVIGEPSGADAVVNRVRAALVSAMAHSPPDQAGLVPSLVVGDTSALPPEVVEQFKATGLTHLTAVSGTNLTLMLVFLLGAARWAGTRGRWLWVVQVGGVIAFVALCRAEPSVIRASAMGLVAMAALGRSRDPVRGLRHLCVAVMAVVVVEPTLARSWGFALSVCATAGILLLAPRLLDAASWLPRTVAEAVVVSLAAQLATTPLVVALSGTVPLAGVGANVVAAPFVGPATVLGLLAALAGSVWAPLGVPFGWLAGWCVQPLLLIARWGSDLSGAQWTWPSSVSAMVVLVVASATLALVVLPWVLKRRVATAVAALVVVAATALPPLVPGWPGAWQVTFCAVGQGDTTVIRAGPSSAIVVDVGPDPRSAAECLDRLGVHQVPLLVLTHFHADHVAGLEAVLERHQVGLVVTSTVASPASSAASVERSVRRHGVPVIAGSAGQSWRAGVAALTIVQVGGGGAARETDTNALDAPHESLGGESALENDSSVVSVASSGDLTVLLPGDIEPEAQQAVLASGRDVTALVLKMPHHGSSRQVRELWARSGARLAVASAGVDNDYGHPAAAALTLAHDLGMQVARTDLQGSLAVRLSGERIVIAASGAGK